MVRVAGRGAEEVAAAARERTDVPVVDVGSTGVPGVEPLVVATDDGRSAFYANATPDDAESVASVIGEPTRALPDADATVTHDETGALPVPDLDGFSGSRSVLARCGWLRPASADDYAESVGFTDAAADEVVDAAGGVLGRGWGDWNADEPAGALWEGVRDRDGSPAVVVNAHGNPGDALLAESDPFAVLEGAAHVARVVDAVQVFVYVSETDERARDTLEAAAAAYPDFPTDVAVVEGPSAYRAAEPTMAIEAVEGNHRLEARLRPPGPEVEGVFGEPTVVHTARTFAHVAGAVRGDDTSTRVLSVTGDTQDVTVELGETDTVRSAVEASGATDYTGVLVGGRFGGLTRKLDVAPTPIALDERDLGTDGVLEVLGSDACPVAFVGRRSQFAADSNCGRCVPCREGSTQLSELLRDIYDGEFNEAKITELLRVMESTSICAFGRNAPRPVRTGLREFRDHFEAHANGECPSGQCLVDADAEAETEAEAATL
ncbi:NADH-ubiquinone oxidoreductase-F iron-sulfur binding region domain-containing protein [Halocalculus aciditolerans]|uniref:NADH dehydrogenase n=1 Tax=Halocalculus aciditolerans TaxID=1383812 RepID=A0A830F8F6_9EURY|nr:NADH-ubiquinone oxidoreductase-F iron-sulfur binding region domain-containing protein [Halocalculus aciditolerans]GGL64881.1 NADH dehydrogenase [Halocalculus aciditolerans]